MTFEIEKKFEVNGKIYFDLILDGKVKINHCFAEEGDLGDMMLRLPTKQTSSGVHQTVWFKDKELFDEICKEVQDFELKGGSEQ